MDWQLVIEVATRILHIPLKDFWAMTMPEFIMLLKQRGIRQENYVSREDLQNIINQYRREL